MQVERYFHIRTGDRGGATVRVQGDPTVVGSVLVQVAFCSKDDQFCRKIGREVAAAAPMTAVPLRYLPRALEQVAEKIMKKQKRPAWPIAFDFSIKYFLPKE